MSSELKVLGKRTYKSMTAPDGRYVFVHRYVAECKVGRPLLPTEDVHHINHNKWDNRPENLEILSRSEHTKIHNPQILPSCKPCEVCGKEFEPNAKHRGRQKTCSSACRWKATVAGNYKLGAEQVKQVRELWSTGQFYQKDLVKMFGVSQATITRVISKKAGYCE